MKNLPDDVYHFLFRYVESVEQLEVLLLLLQAPDRTWTADDVARALYSHPLSVIRRLSLLMGQGLLREVREGSFQYAPRSAELHRTVTRVAVVYQERRVAVTTLIASKPIENIRAFSDAFRLRRPKEE